MTTRGLSIYTLSDLISVSAKDKNDKIQNVNYEAQWSSLDPLTALSIYQRCAPVFAVVSKRANAISALEWHIEPATKQEDKIVEGLKNAREIMMEYNQDDYFSLGKRIKCFQDIKHYLPDCFPDLSNFNSSLNRWYKQVRSARQDRCKEIEEFFYQPNPQTLWPDFIKSFVVDLHIQGRVAIYKEASGTAEHDRVTNLYVMPGGTVVPIKGRHIGEMHGYVQMVDTVDMPILFFQDEICFATYMPNSALNYGMNPLDALINLVSENLLFNALAASMADGTKPPEKAIVFGDKNPNIDIESALNGALDDPIDRQEQRRIESKLNKMKREAGIALITGQGTPIVLDLSRADTFPTQMARQDQINKYVAMVYGATQAEVNETGSDGTSGRSVSETQERSENAKGVRPVIRNIEEIFTRKIIPFRFGFGYEMVFVSSRSDEEQVALAKSKKDSGIFSVNEIRVKDFNEDPIEDPAFDLPQGQTTEQQNSDTMGAIAASLKK